MSSMFGAGFGFLLALPVLIVQWVGVIALGKCGRTGAWWTMLVGTVLSTLGAILSAVFVFVLIRRLAGSGSDQIVIYMAVIGGVSGLGSLLFTVGFAMHGLSSRRMKERVEELESVLAAQSEQLDRQNLGESS